jgi:asparagine synthase (glutamine-hydrolysing)
LKGPLREVLQETLSEQAVGGRGLLDARAVAAVRDQFLAGSVEWSQPWLLMMIELWAREVLDNSQPKLACAQESRAREAVSV